MATFKLELWALHSIDEVEEGTIWQGDFHVEDPDGCVVGHTSRTGTGAGGYADLKFLDGKPCDEQGNPV